MLMPTMDMEELVMELTRCKLALWGACDWAGRPPARHPDHPTPGIVSKPVPALPGHRATSPKGS
jgi:hypothetical protein